MRFTIILKSGVSLSVTTIDGGDITGLWVWMCRQILDQFLNFNEGTIRAQDIAVIMPLEETEEGES